MDTEWMREHTELCNILYLRITGVIKGSNLAECYRYGRGTDIDIVKAFNCYKEAANKGHVNLIYELGELRNVIDTEKELDISIVKAFNCYEETANKGLVNSIYELGECYRYGKGTDLDIIKAFKLYEEAAKYGHVNSIHELGQKKLTE
ncbi:hypothetical protein RclHR1_27030002 [Rhizophagus clarus]|uniref:Sel1 repeat protein n=1 Tax=Rhizophagus clarus TaxID=94130 RepID=A0A2Z6R211_9GLOM|nr:hypothetical protein RclHR1_27030002 [Rhizophagus clarus]